MERRTTGRRPAGGAHGLCSLAATGMGFIALALAAAPPYRLLTPSAAAERLRRAWRPSATACPTNTASCRISCIRPAESRPRRGSPQHRRDRLGRRRGLWAAAFLEVPALQSLAAHSTTASTGSTGPPRTARRGGLLRHGMAAGGRFLDCCWDRLNGETAFMYVLAAGAAEGRASAAESWSALRPFPGSVAGLHFNNADLGLFVFQYGLDLLDLERWRAPGGGDLWADAAVAAEANERACRAAADTFATYRRYWGLSAGDGPGDPSRAGHLSRLLSRRPSRRHGPPDGDAGVGGAPAGRPCWKISTRRDRDRAFPVRGRYGFSNVNVDRAWVGGDMVGIDAGAAVLALDNFLHGDACGQSSTACPASAGGGAPGLPRGRLPARPRASSTPRRSACCAAPRRRTANSTSTRSAGPTARAAGPALALEPPRRRHLRHVRPLRADGRRSASSSSTARSTTTTPR